MIRFSLALFLWVCVSSVCHAFDWEGESKQGTTAQGEVNPFEIRKNGSVLCINAGIGPADVVLLTHARRDIVEAARRSGAKVIVAPESSRVFLEGAEDHWEKWWEARFDYYQQQVTKRPVKSFPATQYLKEGEAFEWEGESFRLISTPGYTRDGASYVASLSDGRKVIFTGELILAGGRVSDLYSFQEEIREAKIGGYHGHMGRLADWIQSVDRVRLEEPDLLVASKGAALIQNPIETLEQGVKQARKIYRNYLSTNALHWYFGGERMNICAERVLGPNHGVKAMPFAEHIDLPGWCQHIGTTKLLVSKEGNGFALDVGGQRALDELKKAIGEGLIKRLDGIFVTHTHNDHSAAVGAAAREFDCPVYALPEVADILENPGNWFLPGVSPNVVDQVVEKKDGETMRWNEFEFTFQFFPGQMYNHAALLVRHPSHEPVFFIGDSFSPSGIDDYCLMNRNLMRPDTGYELCFRRVEELPEQSWLVNQHIPHLFRFDQEELQFLKKSYSERRTLIEAFTPWEDPNFAIDEQWAWFFPYGQEVKAKQTTVASSIRLWNHSQKKRKFGLELKRAGLPIPNTTKELWIEARETVEVPFEFSPQFGSTDRSVEVVTADITIDDEIRLRDWCEMLLKKEN